MLKTHYGQRTVDEAMIDFLNAHEDWDDQIINQGESLRRFGRRILYCSGQGNAKYVRCNTEQEAIKEFDDRRFPDETDAIISEGYSRTEPYFVRVEGVEVGAFKSRDEAEYALAKWMVDNGTFPSCWLVNERGNCFEINEEIRSYHDDGGDKMHPKFTYADDMYPHYIAAMLWSTPDADADEDEDTMLDANWSIENISRELETRSKCEIRTFVVENWADLQNIEAAQAGHDLWLTREGHGAGFWDRGLGEVGERLTNAAKTLGELDVFACYGQVTCDE